MVVVREMERRREEQEEGRRGRQAGGKVRSTMAARGTNQ